MVNAPAISHNVTFSEFLGAWIARATMAAIAASEKSSMLNAGRTTPGSSKRIIRNAGAAINTLNNASMPRDSSEGTFLFIQLGLLVIILFPWHKGILTDAGAVDLLNKLLPTLV